MVAAAETTNGWDALTWPQALIIIAVLIAATIVIVTFIKHG